MKILVTGGAGFIGNSVSMALAAAGNQVVGIDSLNDYYDVRLKAGRLARAGFDPQAVFGDKPVTSSTDPEHRFIRMDIAERQRLDELFGNERFDRVCHLAAQAGVRYSIEDPYAYMRSNIEGTLNVLECCRNYGIRHLVYASSSSVYGMADKVPFSEDDQTDSPVSFYAATKKSTEVMAFSYSQLYGIPVSGLRFFSVYGPWGRPDMAAMLFADAIWQGRPIQVFNNGDMYRDFTYIDDITEGVLRVMDTVPSGNPAAEIYNIGSSAPVKLMDFITTLEECFGKKAILEMRPMQAGDVYRTYADTTRLAAATGYTPSTSLKSGIDRFASWYQQENPLRPVKT